MVSTLVSNKKVADLRRNALQVVRQVAESCAEGKPTSSSPLVFHAVSTYCAVAPLYRYCIVAAGVVGNDAPCYSVGLTRVFALPYEA